MNRGKYTWSNWNLSCHVDSWLMLELARWASAPDSVLMGTRLCTSHRAAARPNRVQELEERCTVEESSGAPSLMGTKTT
jgi:hypothetical protein